MRLIARLVAALLLVAAPSMLAAAEDAPPAATADTRAAELDKLFASLKTANADDAKRIEAMIWSLWHQSGDPEVDKLMEMSMLAMNARAFEIAIKYLSAIVERKPDYAEGWNKRATVYWLADNFGASLADIEKTLALEPRHFGALSGLGMIMRSLGEKQKAADAFRQALEVDPNLDGVRSSLEELEKDLGKDI